MTKSELKTIEWKIRNRLRDLGYISDCKLGDLNVFVNIGYNDAIRQISLFIMHILEGTYDIKYATKEYIGIVKSKKRKV